MQGFNMGRYVPPEHEGTTSANKLAGKHALGARARKAGQGILTVRFEMPFAIWCTTCPNETIIGQGVRFNAEKKKVGNYFSSPIFSFRMRHAACGGTIEIRTDPKNTAYVVTEGARKRDTGEEKLLEGDIRILTEEEREKQRNDAFAALEVKVDDKRKAAAEHSRVDELQRLRDRDWSDPYVQSRKLRKTFRAERNVRQRKEAATEQLQDRLGLGMEILEERDEDKQRAKFVEFGTLGENDTLNPATARPLFTSGMSLSDSKSSKRPSKEKKNTSRLWQALGRELRDNTRLAVDPFIVNDLDWGPSADHEALENDTDAKESSLRATETSNHLKDDAERSTAQNALGLDAYESE